MMLEYSKQAEFKMDNEPKSHTQILMAPAVGLRTTVKQRSQVDDYMTMRLERDGVKLSLNSAFKELRNMGLLQMQAEIDRVLETQK